MLVTNNIKNKDAFGMSFLTQIISTARIVLLPTVRETSGSKRAFPTEIFIHFMLSASLLVALLRVINI